MYHHEAIESRTIIQPQRRRHLEVIAFNGDGCVDYHPDDATWQAEVLADDSTIRNIPLGFSFTYGGATSTNIDINSNGHIIFYSSASDGRASLHLFPRRCDLTLIKDANFAQDLGLDIQIRTKVICCWSYIQNIAIKIGNNILKIEGSTDANDAEAHYWINYEFQGELDTFNGFPVTQKLPSTYKCQYMIIDLSSKYPGASIVVQL